MTLATHDMDFVRTLVRAEAAIVLDESKAYLIEGRLTPVARDLGVAGVAELVAQLRRSPQPRLKNLVVDALTTNETSWFRDRHPFDALREHVLPRLVEARSGSRALTVWCAASSTGQEPYSLAILLREHFAELGSWNLRIVATDISTSALAQAREGLYGQLEVNRGMPAALISRYFQREGTKFRLDERIRKMVEFKELNLAGNWLGVPKSDIVFIRNVMIYFEQATKKTILRKVAREVIRPDGALFLGGAETTIGISEDFDRVQRGPCGWYEPKGGTRTPR